MGSVFWKYFHRTLRWPWIWEWGYLALIVKGGALVLDQAREDILEMRRQAMPETCDDEYLDLIASGRGLKRWPNEPADLWRERVVYAYRYNRMAGRKAYVEKLLDVAGVDATLYEHHEIVNSAAAADIPVLDGGWVLDGSVTLGDYLSTYRFPYSTWAHIVAKVDLSAREVWENIGKTLVNEYKPARSKLISFYGLDINVSLDLVVSSTAKLTKDVSIVWPWVTGRLDGSWALAKNPVTALLDGTLSLDGAWALGETFRSPEPVLLAQRNVFFNSRVRKYVVLPQKRIKYKLGQKLSLDGSWMVGLNPPGCLAQVNIWKERKLDGRWYVSDDNGVVLGATQLIRG